MTRMLHAIVSTVVRDAESIYVGVRCCGDPIQVGDRLVTSAGADEADGALRVERILTYGKYLNRLDTGMTGELALSGLLAMELHGGSELRGESETSTEPACILGEGEFHIEIR
jgi:hypothetical protein